MPIFQCVFGSHRGFQTHVSYGGCNKIFRAMNRFTRPQATKSRLAFLSIPR